MTLEDFKRRFEIFRPIDTAEKLAICENLYQQHVLHLEDENYFEPNKIVSGDNILSQYDRNLNRIFNFNAISKNQIYFLVRPSFEPEQLFIVEKLQDKFVLTLTTLAKSYWLVFYENNKIIDVEKRVLTAELNKATGDKLFKVLNKAISEARQPKSGRIVLDGVVFKLSFLSNGEQKTVSKHSPNETSKSGQIIEIMLQLMGNIENIDDVVLLNIDKNLQHLL